VTKCVACPPSPRPSLSRLATCCSRSVVAGDVSTAGPHAERPSARIVRRILISEHLQDGADGRVGDWWTGSATRRGRRGRIPPPGGRGEAATAAAARRTACPPAAATDLPCGCLVTQRPTERPSADPTSCVRELRVCLSVVGGWMTHCDGPSVCLSVSRRCVLSCDSRDQVRCAGTRALHVVAFLCMYSNRTARLKVPSVL